MRRRRFLVLALFAALLCRATRAAEESPPNTLPPDLGTRKSGADWPDFLGPHRNGRSEETGLPDTFAVGTPKIVWQCELGESYAAPSISRGRLFRFERAGDVHRLICANSETGKEIWTHDVPADYVDMLGYNNGPRCTPVVDGDRVYIQAPEGRLECLRVLDGQPVWSIDATKQFGVVKNFFGVGSTPLVWNDVLIANVGGSPPDSAADIVSGNGHIEGNGTGVVAFDKRTGDVRWRATNELASYASPVIAEIHGRPWCFTLARGGLVALDPRDGRVDFQFPWRAAKLESVNASTPLVIDDAVLISEAYRPGSAVLRIKSPNAAGAAAVAADAPGASEAYEIIWSDAERGRDKSLEMHWNQPVLRDDYLYAASGQRPGEAELRCVEWKTGAVKWRERGLGRSSLLYVDGRLVCLSEEGTLRILRATPDRYDVLADITPKDAQGEPLLTYPAWTAPVLSHGLLYVRGKDRLVCLELIPARE